MGSRHATSFSAHTLSCMVLWPSAAFQRRELHLCRWTRQVGPCKSDEGKPGVLGMVSGAHPSYRTLKDKRNKPCNESTGFSPGSNSNNCTNTSGCGNRLLEDGNRPGAPAVEAPFRSHRTAPFPTGASATDVWCADFCSLAGAVG
jgi:hypothetical protein